MYPNFERYDEEETPADVGMAPFIQNSRRRSYHQRNRHLHRRQHGNHERGHHQPLDADPRLRRSSLDLNFSTSAEFRQIAEDNSDPVVPENTDPTEENGPDVPANSSEQRIAFINSLGAPIPGNMPRHRRTFAISKRSTPFVRTIRNRTPRQGLQQQEQHTLNHPDDSALHEFQQRASAGLIPGFGAAREEASAPQYPQDMETGMETGTSREDQQRQQPPYNLSDQFAALASGFQRIRASSVSPDGTRNGLVGTLGRMGLDETHNSGETWDDSRGYFLP